MSFTISKKYKRKRDDSLATLSKRIVEKMDNNPNFSNPPEALAKLKKLVPEYGASLAQAIGRDKEMVAIKKAKKAEVVSLLIELDSYVTGVCNGEEALLLNSGFDIAGQTEEQLMAVIEKLIIELGHPGQVTIRSKRIRGARAYLHQYSTEPPGSETVWISEGSTKPYFTFRGLKSATKYWFRIVALGTADQVVYSPVDARIVQ
jgi:hypothetical protein